MGGAILRYKAEGFRVGVLDLTNGEPTPHGSLETCAMETAAATQMLGLDWRGNLELPNRSLQPTLEARASLAGVFRQLKPRFVFSPYWIDAHPDHVAAVELIEAARFWSKLTKTDLPGTPHHPTRILYYNCVHLRQVDKPAFVLDISKFWNAKLASIACYRSQFITGRPVELPTFLDRLRIRPLIGDGRSVRLMANRSTAESRSASPACATWSENGEAGAWRASSRHSRRDCKRVGSIHACRSLAAILTTRAIKLARITGGPVELHDCVTALVLPVSVRARAAAPSRLFCGISAGTRCEGEFPCRSPPTRFWRGE